MRFALGLVLLAFFGPCPNDAQYDFRRSGPLVWLGISDDDFTKSVEYFWSLRRKAAEIQLQGVVDAPRTGQSPVGHRGFRGPFQAGVHVCGRLKNMKTNDYLYAHSFFSYAVVQADYKESSNVQVQRPFDWILQKEWSDWVIMAHDDKRLLVVSDDIRDGERLLKVLNPGTSISNAMAGGKMTGDRWKLDIGLGSIGYILYNTDVGEELVEGHEKSTYGTHHSYLYTRNATRDQDTAARWILEPVAC